MRPRGHSASMAHVNPERGAHNLFPTAPWGGRAGGELIKVIDPLARTAWECACGPGHMAHGLRDYFDRVFVSDFVQYGDHALFDFLSGPDDHVPFAADWIVTNPPFDHPEAFVRRALTLARRGVAMLLPLRFLEGQKRWRFLYQECRYYAVAPFSERLPLIMGCWDPDQESAAAYAWFIWVKPGVGPRSLPPRPQVYDLAPGIALRLTRDSDRAFAAVRAAA